ncbi:MAG: peptide chain release factor 1 [Armatimonadetes bacterium]|nr:peptide chain release factor 1 [Armatimonadota bacterium]
MFDKIAEIVRHYDEITDRMMSPDVVAHPNQLQALAKEQSDLEAMVNAYREHLRVTEEIVGTREMLADGLEPDMKELAEAELHDLEARREQLEDDLRRMLLPKDPMDEKNVIMEVRAGTGGDEAALFAGDLFRMYSRYAERQGWKVEILSSNPTGIGGFKEVICMIRGRGAYSKLKYEAGTHRVQRVPATESQGRIHTSAATVAVMPEVEEVDVQIHPDDLRIDTYRAGSAGGQHMQKNDTAVRITHLPTGIVAACQDERSQGQNKERAMQILRSLLYQKEKEEQAAKEHAARKLQVGSGDRSEKIRTYNFPQGRLTDHRINLTIYRLEDLLDGNIGEVVEALGQAEQAERLKGVE